MNAHEERVADQYRAEGYDVAVCPHGLDLPEFLRNYSPDLIARKGEETVVVQIASRADLETDPRLRCLAAEVNARPGWRLDLVVPDEALWPDPVPPDSEERSLEEIQSLADAAERLLGQGELEAACLMAWSAAEAMLRDTARAHGIALEQRSPQFVLKMLVSAGVLSYEEYHHFQSALRVRNAIAHGLRVAGWNASVPEFLIERVRQLREPALSSEGV